MTASHRSTRLAARALIVIDDRLLLVNAYPGQQSDLWCTPGGGVEPGSSLAENMVREVYEETGLTVAAGVVAALSEFHDPTSGFHQVEVFFRTRVLAGTLSDAWQDTERVVTRFGLFSRTELSAIRFRPHFLDDLPFRQSDGLTPYPLIEKAP